MRRVRLTRQLALEEAAEIPDGSGGQSRQWNALGILWADISVRSGREVAAPGGPMSKAAYRITVRGVPVGAASRPRPGQRFREGTRLFAILAVAEADPRARYLTCYANEEIAA